MVLTELSGVLSNKPCHLWSKYLVYNNGGKSRPSAARWEILKTSVIDKICVSDGWLDTRRLLLKIQDTCFHISQKIFHFLALFNFIYLVRMICWSVHEKQTAWPFIRLSSKHGHASPADSLLMKKRQKHKHFYDP